MILFQLRRLFNGKVCRPRSVLRRNSRRLSLEQLESRLAPALYTWDGSDGNGDWNDADNWVSGSIFPLDQAVAHDLTLSLVGAGATGPTLPHGSVPGGHQALVGTLSLGPSFTGANATFTVEGTLSVGSSVWAQNAKLTGGGSLVVRERVEFSDGSLSTNIVYVANGSDPTQTAWLGFYKDFKEFKPGVVEVGILPDADNLKGRIEWGGTGAFALTGTVVGSPDTMIQIRNQSLLNLAQSVLAPDGKGRLSVSGGQVHVVVTDDGKVQRLQSSTDPLIMDMYFTLYDNATFELGDECKLKLEIEQAAHVFGLKTIDGGNQLVKFGGGSELIVAEGHSVVFSGGTVTVRRNATGTFGAIIDASGVFFDGHSVLDLGGFDTSNAYTLTVTGELAFAQDFVLWIDVWESGASDRIVLTSQIDGFRLDFPNSCGLSIRTHGVIGGQSFTIVSTIVGAGGTDQFGDGLPDPWETYWDDPANPRALILRKRV
ncbi:MAG TPA: hypothetical protein VNK04_03425 [Gemmataceae bacterium]|nr:hypothetical protein [Gemmataceae bacterium]